MCPVEAELEMPQLGPLDGGGGGLRFQQMSGAQLAARHDPARQSDHVGSIEQPGAPPLSSNSTFTEHASYET
ncbi:hypothetical protein IFT67_10970 [Sphingomonas sp. CFBP 13728]|uniref:hypothetical protein n=1 Tax=Sphingomonas sp. CFBP 13728 TaxID=2775294 RepID=UPI00177E2A39|nr:hypothetical protein [Sphingomonas sp. CFBP 13728]MBD8619442.1 hypothetical protein [Sphingomonas sp. CFBP 13728]